MPPSPLESLLMTYVAGDDGEALALEQLRLAAHDQDLWSRHSLLHVTGSAIVADLAGGRILLRWHDRLNRWLQVGGHGDSGELDPFEVARREAREETGLDDLRPWPAQAEPEPLHIALVSVPAFGEAPAHRHLDVRYLFTTAKPEESSPESPSTPLRWMSIAAALEEVTEANLAIFLQRVAKAAGWPTTG